MRSISLAVALCAVSVTSCFAQVSIKPTTLIDSSFADIAGGGTFYVVQQVNGVPTANSFQQTRHASIGSGFGLYMIGAERIVHPGPVKLKLKASRTAAAPITSIFRALTQGAESDIEGEVQVTLAPQKSYYVSGKFDGMTTGVWLIDDQGEELADSRVSGPAKPDLAKAMEGALYTTTNLRRDGDWIGEFHTLEQPFIPAGTLIKSTEFRKGEVRVLVDGIKMRVGFYETPKSETIQQLYDRYASAESPEKSIAQFPTKVQRAIRAGRVVQGMTRDQVQLSLGRPAIDAVPDLSSLEWKYAFNSKQNFVVKFDEKGHAKEFIGNAEIVSAVVFSPKE
jgi:SmpA / OmlA family